MIGDGGDCDCSQCDHEPGLHIEYTGPPSLVAFDTEWDLGQCANGPNRVKVAEDEH